MTLHVAQSLRDRRRAGAKRVDEPSMNVKGITSPVAFRGAGAGPSCVGFYARHVGDGDSTRRQPLFHVETSRRLHTIFRRILPFCVS